MQIRPLSPLFGAEIVGVDLSRNPNEKTFADIEKALNERSVVVFPDQRISDDQHVRFSRRFGELEVHVLREFVKPDHPELYVLSNIIESGRPIGIKEAGKYWHTDLSYTREPSRGSIMYAIEVPHNERGEPLGDTLFASTAAAYDALSESMKKKLEGLKGVHRFWDRYIRERKAAGSDVVISEERRAQTPDVVHPLIRIHPYTGKKCIYVNEGFTTNIMVMPDDEAQDLLQELFAHCTREGFIYRHKWRVHVVAGDLRFECRQSQPLYEDAVRGQA